MHIYGPSQLHGAQPIGAPHGPRATQPMSRRGRADADEVDISEAAATWSRFNNCPRCARTGSRPSAGRSPQATYETSDKLNVAVERLLNEIG